MKTLPPRRWTRPERLHSRLLYGLPVAGGSRSGFAPHVGPGYFYGLKGTKHKRPRPTAGALPIYREPGPFSSVRVPHSAMTATLKIRSDQAPRLWWAAEKLVLIPSTEPRSPVASLTRSEVALHISSQSDDPKRRENAPPSARSWKRMRTKLAGPKTPSRRHGITGKQLAHVAGIIGPWLQNSTIETVWSSACRLTNRNTHRCGG